MQVIQFLMRLLAVPVPEQLTVAWLRGPCR